MEIGFPCSRHGGGCRIDGVDFEKRTLVCESDLRWLPRPTRALTFIEALMTERPMRRKSTLAPDVYLVLKAGDRQRFVTWHRALGESADNAVGIARADYLANDWEVA
jgi:hypothetical protein